MRTAPLLLPLLLPVFMGCSRPSKTGQVAPPEGAKPVEIASAVAFTGVVDVAPPAPPVVGPCPDLAKLAFFVSPATPASGAPLRVMAISRAPLSGELALSGQTSPVRRGGPPYFWTVEIPSASAGAHEVRFQARDCVPAPGVATEKTLSVKVAKHGWSSAGPASAERLWPVARVWGRTMEDLYSAWIEALFDAPDEELFSYPALHEILRDPRKNFLFDHLGAGEDSAQAPVLRPDCADLPYVLRAYFAFKLRLPFGVAECSRGGGGAPPSCKGMFSNLDPPAKPQPTAVGTFGAFARGALADRAHSGSARTPYTDEEGDYYPVPLTWDSLRPGTVYADPYGHVLVVAKRLPQIASRGGVLYAVDGQPDGTVARKRFWRGNFLYANAPELGGPGFKRFRPVRFAGREPSRPGNAALSRDPDYGDFSLEPSKLDVEGFYDAMDDVLSPSPMDPVRAMKEAVVALEEQVKTRVVSVENGRKFLEKATSPAPMPEGPEIFETSGPWEDFSTPSRDLRLLIAVDVVRGFPARVARRPERYAMPAGKSPAEVRAELEKTLERELSERKVSYTRTDGSPFALSLSQVLARSVQLETAYDPNDCSEIRWGAEPGSEEASTCRKRAPREQRARMESVRAWFHDRRRPARK